ncbi:MAG: nucleoside triphosphate pyrophosphatase [Steroidobacteraceae bacterium]
MPGALYLASTSPYRAAQLARLGPAFCIEAPQVDEASIPGEAPAARALRLAHAKALAVSVRHPDAWVLGSDQVADCGGHIHDKPGDAARCREQLRASSGRAVEFHTAVVLRRHRPEVVHAHVDRTVVRFRPLGDQEIASYVERDRPFDCAGGFRCEGLGVALFDAVETSDPSALVGLPLIWVAKALRAAGLDPLAAVHA